MEENSTANKTNIFLLCGEDTYSSNQKVNFWKAKFIKKYGEDSCVEVIDGKNLDIGMFDTNIQAVPFLSDKRLIIIKDFFSNVNAEDQKKVAETLEKVPDFCILVFHENGPIEKSTSLLQKIKKLGKIEQFDHMPPEQLTTWILKKAKTDNINIDAKTASYLGLHCGAELWKVSNELEKLKLYAQDQKITQEMIDDLVTPSLSASIFKLTDAVAGKNIKESLKTLQILKDSGEDLIRVFFMIVRHFRILIQIHEMISKKEDRQTIAKKLKQHPFVIQKTSSQSKNFNAKILEKIYAQFLKIDTAVKTGEIKIYQGDDREFQLAIEKLIIDCCK